MLDNWLDSTLVLHLVGEKRLTNFYSYNNDEQWCVLYFTRIAPGLSNCVRWTRIVNGK